MKELSKKILEAAEEIHKAGLRGKGDWVVVAPEFGRQLQEVFDEQEYRRKLRERRLKIEKLRNGSKKS